MNEGTCIGSGSYSRIRPLRVPGAVALSLAAAVLVGGLLHDAVAQTGAARVELVMFDAPDCEFCAAWEHDIGSFYAKTAEGRLAPLRRESAFIETPAHDVLASPVRFSPTFVVVVDGAEHARIEGYPGEDHFWGLLERALRPFAEPDTAKQP